MDTDGETTRDKAMAFATTLILLENKSGYPVAFSVETKGAYLAAADGKWLDHLGIGKRRLRCDNDVSIQALPTVIEVPIS